MKTHCPIIAVLLIASCLFVPSYSAPPRGVCPPWTNEMTAMALSPIQLYCNYDWQCSEGQICCWTRCIDRGPPRCPVKVIGPCIEACGRGCRNGQICCPNGCGHECMAPVA